jgi:hypothetical protein
MLTQRSAETTKIRATNLKTNRVWRGYLDDFCIVFELTDEQQHDLLNGSLRSFQYLGQTWIIETIE